MSSVYRLKAENPKVGDGAHSLMLLHYYMDIYSPDVDVTSCASWSLPSHILLFFVRLSTILGGPRTLTTAIYITVFLCILQWRAVLNGQDCLLSVMYTISSRFTGHYPLPPSTWSMSFETEIFFAAFSNLIAVCRELVIQIVHRG